MTDNRILLVDDDELLRQAVREQLEAEGFAVVEAGDARTALALVAEAEPATIVLDLGLPDTGGGALCRELRERGVATPILLLTGGDNAEIEDADDQLAKPFRIGVLLIRLRALLRRREQAEGDDCRVGPYRFQPGAKLLVDGGDRTIRLTDKEVAIIKYLYRAGKVVARDVLLNEVWGYSPNVDTHTLETHVYRLRRKIEADPANARILVTEPGGYRLVP